MVAMTSLNGTAKQLISVQPDELKFLFEPGKQSFCDLKVTNNTEHNVAFKVKTTSPKKYFVRPNAGIIHPWDSCIIRVTLQAQHEYPPDMQCKDKFLLQSTIVSPNLEVEDLPQDTFNKDSGRIIEECKLRVIYASPNSSQSNVDDGSVNSSREHVRGNSNVEDNIALQRLREERDAAVRHTQQLQQELEMLKRGRIQKKNAGFSFQFALFMAIIGMLLGYLLKLSFAAPATAPVSE